MFEYGHILETEPGAFLVFAHQISTSKFVHEPSLMLVIQSSYLGKGACPGRETYPRLLSSKDRSKGAPSARSIQSAREGSPGEGIPIESINGVHLQLEL